MPEYLSDQWFVAANQALEGLTAADQVTVRFAVADCRTYDLVVGPRSSFETARAEPADVTLSLDFATATAISQGAESAQAAFMSGRMRLGGDAMALVAATAHLETVSDRFAELRAATTYPDA